MFGQLATQPLKVDAAQPVEHLRRIGATVVGEGNADGARRGAKHLRGDGDGDPVAGRLGPHDRGWLRRCKWRRRTAQWLVLSVPSS